MWILVYALTIPQKLKISPPVYIIYIVSRSLSIQILGVLFEFLNYKVK